MAQTPVYDWPNMLSLSLSFQENLVGEKCCHAIFGSQIGSEGHGFTLL